jgi:S-DNA-T family DNA segregation ATPase FtsK/SpoIIIE
MRPQPVEITVSDLRNELWRASGAGVSAMGPSASSGSLFHKTASELLAGEAGWHSILTDADITDNLRLQRHTYDRILGPQLTRMEAALKESGRETLLLWKAVGEACQWLCGVLKAAHDLQWIRYDAGSESWQGADRLIASEQPVSREFQLNNWRLPVRISGIADAILRDPHTGRWCCLEFKLGDGTDPVDLCQAALYHILLEAHGGAGDIALVRFVPERKERILTADQIRLARDELLGLAGRLAGVVKPERTINDVRETAIQYTATKQQESEIIRILRTFGAEVSSAGNPIVGPTFIRFQLKPAPGVPVKKILNRSDDIGVQLGRTAPWIDLEDGVLVVDIARDDRQIVPFSVVRPERDPVHGGSQVPLGVDLNMQVRCIDLSSSDSPHVLVVGTAGSGKTEWLRTAIAALLLSNTPDTLRLVLVDPKRVAFRDLAASPFLLNTGALVLPPDDSVVDVLDSLIQEMEKRYREFETASADDLRSWRVKTGGNMPRFVCVMDEFADMMADPRDRRSLEDRVVRLGAKARAAGIHLILATQHPDYKTVTTRLQANLSVRVCLRTTTKLQSQVALRRSGGERLLGKGDLFYSIGDRLWRMQGPYLDESERQRIFLGKY